MRVPILLLLILIFCSVSNAGSRNYYKKYDTSQNNIVANKIEWPEETDEIDSIKIGIGSFFFMISEEIKGIEVSQDEPLIVVKYRTKKLVIQLVIKDTLVNILDSNVNSSKWKVIDYPEVIFRKTPNDYPKEIHNDSLVAKLFSYKNTILKNGTQTFYCEKGSFRAYMTSKSWGGWDSYLVVTDTRFPDSYLSIQGVEGITLDDLKILLATIGGE